MDQDTKPPADSAFFFQLFAGNSTAHYVRQNGQYETIAGEITLADVERHVRGVEPSLLSIPILPSGMCHFAALDVDRHQDDDLSVDHGALAKQISELDLPLIVCRSKNPKSAHLWLFFKEEAGFSAAQAQQLLERYRELLGISGGYDIFPRQAELKDGQLGNGINLPLFGSDRAAFGRNGEVLNLAGFIALAQERASYGQLLANRDLRLASNAASLNAKNEYPPLPINTIRELYKKKVSELQSCPPGSRNDTLNRVAFFAGQAFAAGALNGSESEIKMSIAKAAHAAGLSEQEIHVTAASGWNSGLQQPLKIAQWRDRFHTGSQLEAGDVRLYIDRFLPEGVTAIGSLSAVGKTWLALSMARALCTATKFLGVLDVPEVCNVIYLVPEMGSRALRRRMEKMRLPMDDRFFCQTVSDYVLKLSDPVLESAVSELHPVVFLDTAIRFNPSADENNARQNSALLASDLHQIVRWGAKAVVCLHHSPKYSGDAEFMTLENVLRGTGDMGAMCDAVWGLQHDRRKDGRRNGKDWDYDYLEESQNLTRLYVKCVKPRDFEPLPPFRIQGRPFIDERADFAVLADVESAEQAISRKIGDAIRKEPNISLNRLRETLHVGKSRVEGLVEAAGWYHDKEKGIWQSTKNGQSEIVF